MKIQYFAASAKAGCRYVFIRGCIRVYVCTYVRMYVRMSHSVSPKVPIVGSSNLAWMFTTINQPWGRGGFPWRWV